MAISPLCDVPGFTRTIEDAYRTLWERWCGQGETAPSVSVPVPSSVPAPPAIPTPLPASALPRLEAAGLIPLTPPSAHTPPPPPSSTLLKLTAVEDRRPAEWPRPPGLLVHIGGEEHPAGWLKLEATATPGASLAGSCSDLSRLKDNSCAVVYLLHVLEHLGYNDELPAALAELKRVLVPGGLLLISVPDMAALSRLFVGPAAGFNEKFLIMRMLFGGRSSAADVKCTGFDFDLLSYFLLRAGFGSITRVPGFGFFDDISERTFLEAPISLNVAARKEA
jgi:predicted SAM-dependent methyltransferase